MKSDLLFEIGLEEVPAKFLQATIKQLYFLAVNKFQNEKITYSKIETFATPRRLVLVIRDVLKKQNSFTVEKRGPSLKIAFDTHNNLTKEAKGFAQKQGINANELIIKENYIYAVIRKNEQSIHKLFSVILIDIIKSLNFPVNMRWGNLDIRFIRPIRWLVALFGNELINFSVADIVTGRFTQGHRYIGEKNIYVKSVNDYFEKIEKNYCILDQNLRKQIIKKQIKDIAAEKGAIVKIDEELLEEVTFLVEYPTAFCGNFGKNFLKLPPEAIIILMQKYQHYFPLFNINGDLLPIFIAIRNGDNKYINIVKYGNENVLKARLSDAQFFYNKDKQVPLHMKVEKLKSIIFQEGVGTIYDKTIRLEKIVEKLSEILSINEIHALKRSAYLSKADLVTGMVCEFTELQGVMGRQYALIDGETTEVANAIFEHYLPRNINDKLPETPNGKLLSIADKLDNIVATFCQGLAPTGSQDPHALRRQALGIVNILIASKYHLSLKDIIKTNINFLNIKKDLKCSNIINEIREFIYLRFKNILIENGMRYDLIDAILIEGDDDIYDAWLRSKTIQMNTKLDAFFVLKAFIRVKNLVTNYKVFSVDPTLFICKAENNLFYIFNKVNKKLFYFKKNKNYDEAYKCLAELSEPINMFLDQVMVMSENMEIRNNRLSLLYAISKLTKDIINLNKIIN